MRVRTSPRCSSSAPGVWGRRSRCAMPSIATCRRDMRSSNRTASATRAVTSSSRRTTSHRSAATCSSNSLFYRNGRGARVGDLYMTLIYTAALHGENPFEYLTALLAHERQVDERPADWLPWTYRTTLERLEAGARHAA